MSTFRQLERATSASVAFLLVVACGGAQLRRSAASAEESCAGGDGESCVVAGGELEDAFMSSELERALSYFQRACELGAPEGCEGAARLLLDGPLVLRDQNQAIRMFLRACDEGRGPSCNVLALLNYRGVVVPRNPSRGYQLGVQGCALGAGDACGLVSYRVMHGRGIPADPVRGVELAERACRLGSSRGCNNLGHYHRRGSGVTTNIARAQELFEQACSQHHVGACLELAGWYRSGDHVERDIGRANEYYRRALLADPVPEGVEMLRSMPVGRVLDIPDQGRLVRRPRSRTNHVSTKLNFVAPIADHLALDILVLPASHIRRAVIELVSTHEDWRYEGCDVELWADGRPIRLGSPNYRRGSLFVRETLLSYTSLDQVWRLASADRVGGRVCEEEFRLTSSQMYILRQMRNLARGLRNGAIPPERGSVCTQNARDCR